MRKTSNNTNIAARAGRWSAQNRKKAIVGWLVFVILAVFVGGSVGTKTLDQSDNGSGESGRADKVVADHFPDKSSESVLVQSQTAARNRDPEFRQTVETVVSRLEDTQHVRNVESPYARDSQGALSEDGRSALVTFELAGDEADAEVDPALATVAKLDRQEAGFRIEEFGDA
ncbi:MAG: MMPL family transporter, partial [Pseudonocardiaceae bacterium]